MQSYFHACIVLLGTALLGGALLPACGSECAAQCLSFMMVTVTNADVTAHSYTITVQGAGFTTVTETCTVSTTACAGGAFEALTANGQIQLELMVDPVPVDVTVTRDGAQVASAHLVPTGGTNNVCGTECATGTATLALP